MSHIERLLVTQWHNLTPRTNPGLVAHFAQTAPPPPPPCKLKNGYDNVPYEYGVYYLLQRYVSWREVVSPSARCVHCWPPVATHSQLPRQHHQQHQRSQHHQQQQRQQQHQQQHQSHQSQHQQRQPQPQPPSPPPWKFLMQLF